MTERAEQKPEVVDVVVIGMGVAGESVAAPLAEAGLRVVGIESGLVGGECPYWGCVPSKMMIRAANLLAEARRVHGMAGQATVEPDWAPVAARIREEATDDWNDQVAVDRFEGKGGIFVRGRARFEGPGRVAAGGRLFHAERGVVIATGTSPAVPPIPGIESVDFWTNREVIEAKELPASVVVLGAGAIGAELSQAMRRFGTEVTIVEALDRVLPLEEPEAGALIQSSFEAEGITVHVGTRAVEVRKGDLGVEVELDDGTVVAAERLVVATGRRTDLSGLGVDAIGLDASARFVDVDDHLRAGERLWAVGDITGKGLFTHVGMYQGAIAAADILGRSAAGADYSSIGRVTFTDPEVGSVGLTEAAAREARLDVAAAVVEVPGTARGWLHGAGNEGLIKLVADRTTGVLVGATAAGPHGGEVLGLLALAVHARTPLATMRSMVYAYPTFHKGIEDALNRLEV